MIFRQFRNWILSWTYSSLVCHCRGKAKSRGRGEFSLQRKLQKHGASPFLFLCKVSIFSGVQLKFRSSTLRNTSSPLLCTFLGLYWRTHPIRQVALACAQTSLFCTPIDRSLWREWSVPTLGLGASGFHQTSLKPWQPICHPRLFPASSPLRSCWCITYPKPENHWKKNSL